MAEVVECLNLARKRNRASPIWNNLRRRVASVESALPVWEEECDSDRSEKFERMVKKGGKGKVSSVSRVGYGNGSEASNNNDKVMRSKSIGSGSGSLRGSWVKMQQQQQQHQTDNGFGRRKVRLKKSKSMGVLQGSLLLHYGIQNNNNDVREWPSWKRKCWKNR
ncbi:hypothetical protein glysoja_021831 [Glycine soja]|nr:hypothetical protein glysoja_021831 [Glycine soja]